MNTSTTQRGAGPRPFWLAVLALALALLAPAAPARAEVLDFDPLTGEVPTLVPADELDLIQSLQGAGYQYLISPPSPAGTYAFGYIAGGLGFLNLDSGEFVSPESLPVNYLLGQVWWQDDSTLGLVSADMTTDDEGRPLNWQLSRVLLAADSGAVTVEALTTLPPSTNPLAASPGLDWLLALEVPEGSPARQVTFGPRYERSAPLPEGLAADLPGILGGAVVDSITLHQAPTRAVLRSLTGEERRVLVDLPADSGLFQAAWSPDGQRVVLGTSTLPGWDGDRQRDNDPPGAGLPNLGSVNVQEALGNLAPAVNPIVTGTRLAVFDASSGAAIKTFANSDYQSGWLQDLLWSPAGSRAVLMLADRSELEGRQHPVYSFPSGLSYWLLDEDLNPLRQISGPGLDSLSGSAVWLDEERLLFAVPDELDTRLDRFDAASGSLETVWARPGSSWQVLAGGGKVAFPRNSVDEPMELWVGEASDLAGSARAVTDAHAEVGAASRLKTVEITWPASNGRTLTGLYVYREDMPFPPASPGPVVVWQQGGPGGQMTNDFGTRVEAPYSLLPQFGIPVFMANAAGRSVQDAEFFSDMAAGRNFGQLDIQQVKEGVEALIARKIVDPERVGVTGCSYGGYFTLQSLRSYPDFYAAANPQCSLMDLFEEFTFGYAPVVSYLMGRAPMAEPEEYLKDSPLYGAKEVTTPTLLFHGQDDFLPVALPELYHDELAGREVPVTFFRVANEGHGFGYPESQLYAAQLQLNFFRDHLGVADTSPRPEPQGLYLPITYTGR